MKVPVLILVCLFSFVARVSAERVGFREDFSNSKPGDWEISKWPGITGLESITSDGQQTTFTTLAGTFLTGASAAWAPTWPDWDKNAPAGLAMIVKKYPTVVDLDQYHFLVARMTHTGTYTALAVNGWDTKVCYTTGLHAVDLRDIQKPSLRGRQPVELRLTFLNTGARVTLDEVRLVDALTPEEQAGFIPAGLDLRLERREPRPYHGLAVNFRTGATTTVADWTSTDHGGAEFGASPYSDRLVLGLKEGRALYLIDPKTWEPSQRVRRVPLPMRMKGASLSHNDQRVNWQRCYYFQPWQMDLQTGAVQIARYPTYGGHEARTPPRSPTCATCWATPTSTWLSQGGRRRRGT